MSSVGWNQQFGWLVDNHLLNNFKGLFNSAMASC